MKGKTPTRFFGTLSAAFAIGMLAPAFPPLAAQDTAATAAIPAQLTLGDSARIAARNSAPAQSARIRHAEAQARVVPSRADQLPSLNASASPIPHTLPPASFRI